MITPSLLCCQPPILSYHPDLLFSSLNALSSRSLAVAHPKRSAVFAAVVRSRTLSPARAYPSPFSLRPPCNTWLYDAVLSRSSASHGSTCMWIWSGGKIKDMHDIGSSRKAEARWLVVSSGCQSSVEVGGRTWRCCCGTGLRVWLARSPSLVCRSLVLSWPAHSRPNVHLDTPIPLSSARTTYPSHRLARRLHRPTS